MPRISISYRRDDSETITNRIFDRLQKHYGRDRVFLDTDSLPYGADFRDHITSTLGQSDMVLAIIGPKWLGRRGGRSRLDEKNDPVRIEIETCLGRRIPVVPVLVHGAKMPEPDQLPETLKDFHFRHAIYIDHARDFDIHIKRLLEAVDRVLRANAPKRLAWLGMCIAGLVGLVAGGLATAFLLGSQPPNIAALEARIHDQQGRAENAERDLKTQKDTAAKLQSQIDQAKRDLAMRSGAYDSAQIQLDSLQKQINILGNQQKRAERAENDLSTEKEVAAKLQTQLDQAKRDLADQKEAAAKLQAQRDQATQDLAAQKRINDNAQTQLANQLAAESKAHQEAVDQLASSSKTTPQQPAAQLAPSQKPLDTAERLGPSFLCNKGLPPLALAVCTHGPLARSDLEYVQAYQALRQQQIQEQGTDQDAKTAALKFPKQTAQECGVPESGAYVPSSEEVVECIEEAYKNERETLLDQLNGTAAEEARRSLRDHITLQNRLITLGYLPAGETNDGVYGGNTREAIKQWQRAQGRPQTGLLGNEDARALASGGSRAAKSSDPGTSR